MEVITANSLGDGRVVFQTANGWTLRIDEAEILGTKAEVEAALKRANRAAAENRVVEPYAIETVRVAVGINPVRLREKIRADGPTTGNSLPKGNAVPDKAA